MKSDEYRYMDEDEYAKIYHLQRQEEKINDLCSKFNRLSAELHYSNQNVSKAQVFDLARYLGIVLAILTGVFGTALWISITDVAENKAEEKAKVVATNIAEKTAKTISHSTIVKSLIADPAFNKTSIENLNSLLPNAVLAFSDVCPPGWKEFKELGGRTLLGAGAHSNKDENGKLLSTYKIGDHSGVEQHQLTIQEIPSHSHSGDVGVPGYRAAMLNPTNNAYHNGKHQSIGNTGGNKPHNNMSPYLALQFCIKE